MTLKLRATKIVATMGPATSSSEVMEELVKAGVNIIRMNFSHGDFDFHLNNINTLRKVSKKLNKHVGIIADLPGPKIRIESFENSFINLILGQKFILDTQKEGYGNESWVGVGYKDLPQYCKHGDILLLDDGNVELEVIEVQDHKIITKALTGGVLSDKKGINLKGGGLNANAITLKDRTIIEFVTEQKVDFIAVSFVSKGSDLDLVRKIAENIDSRHIPKLISKIERADIFKDKDTLDDLLQASDGVMVARGDLAVEVGVGAMLGLQKTIIEKAVKHNKFVITATQMMESMINSPTPTRAEISDVGNAVLDSTDAVMLSAETAIGNNPIRTVEQMVKIAIGVEEHVSMKRAYKNINDKCTTLNQIIAASAVNIANTLNDVGAILCLSLSGETALWLSRYVSSVPIIGISNSFSSARFMNILSNVHPKVFSDDNLVLHFEQRYLKSLVNELLLDGIIKIKHKIVLTKAFNISNPVKTKTNSLTIHSVEEVLSSVY